MASNRAVSRQIPPPSVWSLPLVAMLAANLMVAQATNDPALLQKRGIEHFERCRDAYFRSSTNSFTAVPPLPPICSAELRQAEQDLTASNRLFDGRKQYAAEAYGTIKLAKVVGMLQNPQRKSSLLVYAVQMAELAGDSSSEAKAFTALAADETQLGQLKAAERHITDAIGLAEHSRGNDDLASALDVAGEVETKLNNYIGATEYLNRGLEKYSEIQDPFLLYYLYEDRGIAWSERGQQCDYKREFKLCFQELEAARADYKKAVEIARQRGYTMLVDMVNSELPLLDTYQQHLQQMESLASQLAESQFQIENASQVIYHDRFSTGPNANSAALARTIMQQNGLTGTTASPRALYLEGKVLEWEGRQDAALNDYLKAVDLLEKDRTRLEDEQSRNSLMESEIDLYYAAILELLDHKRIGEAFELMERSRSRAMVDLLYNRPPNLGSTVEGDLLAQATKLNSSIAAEQIKLLRWSQNSSGYKDQIAESQAKITALQAQDRQLQVQIAKSAPRLQSLLQAKLVSLEQAQAQARSGQYDLLYYLVVGDSLIVWHITGDDVEIRNVFFSRDLLNKTVAALRESMTRADARFDERSSRELFLVAINPVLKFVKTRHLVVVAHESLNLLPFQALQNPADGSYLGERFEITYAPSATVLASLAPTRNIAERQLLAIADPGMADSVAEVRAIADFFPSHSRVITEVMLRNDELKRLAGNYNILHLSMHGEFDSRDPMLSFLLMRHPSAQDDGRFTAADLFALPLPRNSLVVLSACETGKVTVTHGNELMGMERALLFAGASALVLTSWEVHAPSTELWMKTFYREAQSKPPAEAARLALITVKKQAGYAHPFYWGPFLLTGN